MFGCQHGRAPQYLIDCCLPVSVVASRQHLRSASRRILVVQRHRLSTYGRRAFAVAGPTAWNSFQDNLQIQGRVKLLSAAVKRFTAALHLLNGLQRFTNLFVNKFCKQP